MINNYKTSDKGIKLIIEFEGFEPKPYKCSAGVPTIGYGTTFIDGKPVTMTTQAITESRGKELLRDHIVPLETQINKSIKVKISQNHFDALVSFVYNVGFGNFKKSTLLRLLNQNRLDLAVLEFSKWNKAGGKEVTGLTRRRQAEAKLFQSS